MKPLRDIIRFAGLRNRSLNRAASLVRKGDQDSLQKAQYHQTDAEDFGAKKIPASKRNYMKGSKNN
jgi:hypothetical protein